MGDLSGSSLDRRRRVPEKESCDGRPFGGRRHELLHQPQTAVDVHVTALTRQPSRYQLEKRRLSRPVGTYERDVLAVTNPEGDPVEQHAAPGQRVPQFGDIDGPQLTEEDFRALVQLWVQCLQSSHRIAQWDPDDAGAL